ncbi:acetyl-CoA carboxylase biotin carboxyl carrier protein [Candidatus Termititenax aidoneus]|uniref:Biotin carboxyl carrier protein of acetyl-CoA carboxylase n=1 Tax=Termititenax aidoneus TaxID=2218524 RepID=A0A388TCD8_TERA1|nr:acetyl-CoA carboxylase biotin carboxyl carrier protein [Candidatus Termititenax aidoneus]
MDFKKIEELIKLVEQSDINGLAVEEGDFKIEIQKNQAALAATPPSAAATPDKTIELAAPELQPAAGLQEIKSPMTGTFYQAASPDNPPLVSVGAAVAKGQPVCVIEAMKTFNEIEADIAGTIEKILVANAQLVEAGQPLFLVRA